jgi:hypothetical protein
MLPFSRVKLGIGRGAGIARDSGLQKNVVDEYETVARELHGKFVKFLEDHGTDEALLLPRREFP